ncbi:MAG: type III pantothenate kinase [Pseudomonadota bacterium]
MLLVVDVGNTHTVLGIYKGKELVKDWRVHTEKETTEDEINVLISNLFAQGGISMRDIRKTVISCVFPPIVRVLDAFCRKYLGHAPHWVNAKSYPAMPILTKNPSEVGADRIVNAVAAYQKYRTSLIVIDFGTATTFDVVSSRGEYLGGAICPGVHISSEALFQEASKLPRVEIFIAPECVIGKDTITSIQSGIIYGYAGLVDGMVRRIRDEMNEKVKVIATGGLAHLIHHVSETIESVEPTLTLEGLRIISESG